MFYIGFYRQTHQQLLSETTRPRALVFGLKHHTRLLLRLAVHCSNCQYYLILSHRSFEVKRLDRQDFQRQIKSVKGSTGHVTHDID